MNTIRVMMRASKAQQTIKSINWEYINPEDQFRLLCLADELFNIQRLLAIKIAKRRNSDLTQPFFYGRGPDMIAPGAYRKGVRAL